MSRSVESLLEAQFEAINEIQEPVTVGEILDHGEIPDHDRPIVTRIPETPRPAGVGSRIGMATAVIALVTITLLLAWYTSTVPQLDPADSDGIMPQPTPPPTLFPSEGNVDLVEPTIAGSAFDVGWTLHDHQLDLSGLGELQMLAVRQSVGLFWALQNNSGQYWVSDDGTSWDPVEGAFLREPPDFEQFIPRYRISGGFLRIDDTIVTSNSDAMWVSTDRGRSFTHIEDQGFEGLLFDWSWVAEDAFWVITEHPDRVTLNTADSPNTLDDALTLDETKPRQLWTSHDGIAWTLVGDVSGLPPSTISIFDGGFLGPVSAAIAVDDQIVLTVLPPSIDDGNIIFSGRSWLLYRSADEGLTWEPFADLPKPGKGKAFVSEPTGTVDGWMHATDLVTNDGFTWYTISEPVEVEINAGRFGKQTNPSRTVAVPPTP